MHLLRREQLGHNPRLLVEKLDPQESRRDWVLEWDLELVPRRDQLWEQGLEVELVLELVSYFGWEMGWELELDQDWVLL